MVRLNNVFSCRIRDCSFTSTNKGRLKCHLKSHGKLKKAKPHGNVECPQCNWRGKQGSLAKHLRNCKNN